MIKYYLKLAAIAALAVATVVLAIIEIKFRGTISGITLIPSLIGLVWALSGMVKRDIKDILNIYRMADDE